MQNYNFGIIYIMPMCLFGIIYIMPMCLSMEILRMITMKRPPYLIRRSFFPSMWFLAFSASRSFG